MRVDPQRKLLIVPTASYGSSLSARLLVYEYSLDGNDLVRLKRLHAGVLPIDPSDMLLLGEDLIVLGYPRRFEEDSSSKIVRISLSNPLSPVVTAVAPFEPQGWMTEYVTPAIDDGLLYVTDVFGHLFEIAQEDLSVLRKVRPGASTLEAAVWKENLFAAAPYARSVLRIDRKSLRIEDRLRAGNAMREVEADPARDRLFATAYGDGVLHGWSFKTGSWRPTAHGALRLGSPMRGLALLGESGDVLVGAGCGLFRVSPSEALRL
jgi:hypothetical protein